MKQFALPYISLICFAFAISSCSTGLQQDPSTFVDVEDQIELSILQEIGQENQYLILISTLEDELCPESEFVTSYEVLENQVNLDIQGLEIPNDCSNFTSSIQETKSFDIIGESMVLDVTLARNIENKIYINRVNNQLNFVSTNLEGILFEQTQMFHLKDTYLWGGVASDSEEDINLFNELLVSIQEVIDFKPLQSGNYGYFLQAEKFTAIHPATYKKTEQGFAFEVSSETKINETDIPSLIESFRISNPLIDFFIASGDGNVF